jgi:hypothetical protein
MRRMVDGSRRRGKCQKASITLSDKVARQTMRSTKGSRRIVVHHVEYRWRATGNDGFISIGIWPVNNVGPFIYGNLRYHETTSTGDQIVITNRLLRQIIQQAITEHRYDPHSQGTQLNLRVLDEVINWGDAVRATRKSES